MKGLFVKSIQVNPISLSVDSATGIGISVMTQVWLAMVNPSLHQFELSERMRSRFMVGVGLVRSR